MKKIVSYCLLFIAVLLTVNTAWAQRKNSTNIEKVEDIIEKPMATYQGVYKVDFLEAFYAKFGRIVFATDTYKFTISLIIENNEVSDVIVLGIQDPKVKEGILNIAKQLNNWESPIVDRKAVKAQVTIPFNLLQYDNLYEQSLSLTNLKPESYDKPIVEEEKANTTNATYPDGMAVFQQEFVNLFIPPHFDGDKLRFAVRFIVEVDGSVRDVKLMGLYGDRISDYEKEVQEIFNQLKPWIPATVDGKPVRAMFTQPFTILVSEEKK
ncbi:MAG: energy transducer TonB [Flavobacteriaceae bacterium]|jgi:hypothetical protein|nr:energy transducer TonB [Flavobacteriaceae bacterium]